MLCQKFSDYMYIDSGVCLTHLISRAAVMSPLSSFMLKGVPMEMLYFIAAAAPVSRSVAIT